VTAYDAGRRREYTTRATAGQGLLVTAWPVGNRRACTCGESFICDGPVAPELLATFEADHQGDGCGPSKRPPSKDGRAP
jgi:hypothetical protein